MTVKLSPARKLAENVYNRFFTRYDHLNICIGDEGKVVGNTKNLVLVKFPTRKDTLPISPEYLIYEELTDAGKRALETLKQFTSNNH